MFKKVSHSIALTSTETAIRQYRDACYRQLQRSKRRKGGRRVASKC